MKSLEELAMTTSNLPSLLTHVILAEVEEAARARRFGRNLVRINEDLVRTKGTNLVFYRRGVLSASSVSEGATPTLGTITYTPHTLTVSKYGLAVKVTQEAIDGSRLDLIRDSIREAGIALADKEDTVIVGALTGCKSTARVETVTVGTGGGGKGTISITPIFGLQDVSLAAGINKATINVLTGVLSSDSGVTAEKATISYYYSSSDYVYAKTGGTFSYQDVVSGANVIRGKKWSPDFMLIHPEQMSSLLKSSQFVDYSKYGAREPLLRGEIGQISGLRVLVSTNVPRGSAIILASKRAGWLAIKRPIDLKRWDNPSTDSIELYFYMEYGAKVTDEDAIVRLIGLGPLVFE